MKTKYLIIPLLAIGSVSFFSAQLSSNAKFEKYKAEIAHKFSSGSPVAKTGAPGEQSCTSCHGGSALPGNIQNQLKILDNGTEVASYIPGETYMVSLTLATGDVKEGFSATALLNSDNTAAGSFPGLNLVGTQVGSSGGRSYATHTSSSNQEGNVAWEWDWIAPGTDQGPVTFYVASNKANGNSQSSGDEIYISQHTVNSTLGLSSNVESSIQFSAGYNAYKTELSIQFSSLSSESTFINLINSSGKSVFTKHLGVSQVGLNKHEVELKSDLQPGVYFVHFFLGNKPVTSKVVIY